MSSVISIESHSTDHRPHAGNQEEVIPAVSGYFAWSAWIGRLAGLLMLVPAAPVIGFLALLTRLTSKGPGLYPQTRVGLNGQTFTLYKIRTMRQDAEAGTGPVWAQLKDPRITFLGRILRTTHLDELPQLLNVINGEMCLVGPRPERPEFTQFLAREIPGYVQRLAIKPGITGLAQINLPPDTDVDSVRKKLALDLEYIHAAGLWMDFRILLCTAVRLLGIRGLTMATLVGLYRKPRLVAATPKKNVEKSSLAKANGSEPCHTVANGEASTSIGQMHISLDAAAPRNACCHVREKEVVQATDGGLRSI